MQGQETLAGHGIVVAAPPWIRQRLWWERVETQELKRRIVNRLHCQQRTATEVTILSPVWLIF